MQTKWTQKEKVTDHGIITVCPREIFKVMGAGRAVEERLGGAANDGVGRA